MLKVEVSDIAMRLVEKLRKYSQPGENVIKIEVVSTINNKKEHAVVEKVETLEEGEVFDDREDVRYKEKSRNHFLPKSETWRNPQQNFDDVRISTSDDGGMISATNGVLASTTNTSPSLLSHKLNKLEKRKAIVGNLFCKFFREGRCLQGIHCVYSHRASDSHRRPELCKFYKHGTCKQGPECNFLHGEFPCKFFQNNKCKDPKCRFSHQPLDDYTKPIFEKVWKVEKSSATPSQRKTLLSLPEVSPNSIPLIFQRKLPLPFNHVPSPFQPTLPSYSTMRTSDVKLSTGLNKYAFRHSATPYSRPPPHKAVNFRNVHVENRLSSFAFEASNMRNRC